MQELTVKIKTFKFEELNPLVQKKIIERETTIEQEMWEGDYITDGFISDMEKDGWQFPCAPINYSIAFAQGDGVAFTASLSGKALLRYMLGHSKTVQFNADMIKILEKLLQYEDEQELDENLILSAQSKRGTYQYVELVVEQLFEAHIWPAACELEDINEETYLTIDEFIRYWNEILTILVKDSARKLYDELSADLLAVLDESYIRQILIERDEVYLSNGSLLESLAVELVGNLNCNEA